MMKLSCFLRSAAWFAAIMAAAAPAAAGEYRSVADPVAVLYDAPSLKARKIYIVNQGYPMEVVVTVEGWVKVRDASGDLAWIESRQLSEKRTVIVKSRIAQVRQAADDNALVVFRAEQGVVLEFLEIGSAGWLRVRHRDGQTGFVSVTQVWGG